MSDNIYSADKVIVLNCIIVACLLIDMTFILTVFFPHWFMCITYGVVCGCRGSFLSMRQNIVEGLEK